MIPATQNPYKMWHVVDGKASTVISDHQLHSHPRQLIEKSYMQNACIDIVKRETILEKKSMVGQNCLAFVMNSNFNIDIDTERDLKEAENALRFRNGE
jgi:CMP-N-acetylneuraminic acid synthetase